MRLHGWTRNTDTRMGTHIRITIGKAVWDGPYGYGYSPYAYGPAHTSVWAKYSVVRDGT